MSGGDPNRPVAPAVCEENHFPLSPFLRGEGRGEGQPQTQRKILPLTLTLSP